MHSLRIQVVTAALIALLALGNMSLAQSRNRKIGTQFTVTADPLVPRPAEKPCTVQLFSGLTFAMFSESVQNFQYTPPADCPGPWAAVVLEADFSENAGVQFDRTASMYFNNTMLYFGTTPEPLANDTNTWHVERDVTDYSALLSAPQTGTMVLPNCTSDCPPPYQYLNGIFTVNADLQFYPLQGNGPARPDAVLPMLQSNGSGGYNLPASVNSPTQQFSTTFTLPTNVEQAYLDVVTQGQSGDEFWYTCVPNDLTTELQSCGGTAFREAEISIDGTPAGVAPVYPWIFTGGIDPFLWIPIPGVQTLDFIPYRVNLTPFAGLLSNGQQHTVAMSVLNVTSAFSVTGTLLLFEDHGSQQVTGAVTSNTIKPPNPVITTDLHVNGSNVIGTVKTVSDRQFQVAGYVNTSHGKVNTIVQQSVNFSNLQGFKITPNIYVQDISQLTPVNSDLTQVGGGSTFSTESLFYPLTLGITVTFPNGQTVETTTVQQEFKDIVANPQYSSTVDNLVNSQDTLNFNSGVNDGAKSSQQYTFANSYGQTYSCGLATKNNTLKAVGAGCNQTIGFKQ
ncbi:MAG TPA: peptide-N4-asparagine amidase [Terriglobales bacterium]|nr:peptide-N4-asparagine amidase [Terriglobales bacterium]